MKVFSLLALATATILISCSSNSNPTSTTQGSTSQLFRLQVTSPVRWDTAQHLFQQGKVYCNGASIDTGWYYDTTNYSLRSDTLYEWSSGNCTGTVLLGSSSIYGTWNAQEGSVSVASISPSCTGSSASTTTRPYKVSFTYTPTSLTTVIRDSCLMDSYFFQSDSTMKKLSCSEESITDSLGHTATVTITMTDTITSSIAETFVYNGKTCTTSASLLTNESPSVSLCKQAWASYQKANPGVTDGNYMWEKYTNQAVVDSTFRACVSSSGFKASM